MKTSRKIFIAFFIVFGFVLLAFLIPASDKHIAERKAQNHYTTKSFDVPSFSHLKVGLNCSVKIRNALTDTFKIRISQHPDSVVISPRFHLQGDTLVITSTQTANSNQITLMCGNLVSISSKGRVSIESLQDSLFVSASKGRFALEGKHKGSYLEFVGSDCELFCHTKTLKVADIKLERSRAKIYSGNIEFMRAELKDHSKLTSRTPLNMDLERDKTSRYYAIN